MAQEEKLHECEAPARPRAFTSPSTPAIPTQTKNLPDEAVEPLRVLAFDIQSTCAQLFSKQLSQHLRLGRISHPYVLAATLGPERIHHTIGNDKTKKLWRGRAEAASSRVKRTTYTAATNDLLRAADKLEKEGKTVFITEYPPFIMKHDILASALESHETIISRLSNPTLIPDELLKLFTPIIFIAHPALVLPTWLRLAKAEYGSYAIDDADFTLWTSLRWSRMLFDYLRSSQHLRSPSATTPRPSMHRRSTSAGVTEGVHAAKWDPGYVATRPYILDAADVASNTHAMLAATCRLLGIDYQTVSATWLQYFQRAATSTLSRAIPARISAAWSQRALASERVHINLDNEYLHWIREFGPDVAKVLRSKVDSEMVHYRYLERFKVRVQPSLTVDALAQTVSGVPFRRASAATPTREEVEEMREEVGHPLRIIRSAMDLSQVRQGR